MTDSTQIAKRAQFSPEVEARLAENKIRNQVAAQIRGQTWSKELGADGVRALAEYCRSNGLDPVRHVEVLGGRVYLTATLYEERAAPMIRSGELIPAEPDFINVDERLDKLEAAGDEWAKGENLRRVKARIEHNAPEKALAIVVKRITVAATGQTIVGVNWCGGGVRRGDPVGDSEPTKTATTRAGRRAWKQVTEAVEVLGQQFARMESAAEVTGEIIGQEALAEPARARLHGGAEVGHSLSE